MIYYFSGTGNSWHVARLLAKALGERTAPVDPAGTELTEALTGLVFPVYFGEIPRPVRSFLERSRFAPEGYFFSVGTCGSTIGSSLQTVDALLRAKGRQLDYGARLAMVANSTPAARSHIHYAVEKLDGEAAAVKAIATAVWDRVEDRSLCRSSLMGSLFRTAPGQAFQRWFFKLSVLPERCTGCGLCVGLCPAANISLASGKAVHGQNCAECLACLHACPVQAVTVRGREILPEDQYHHPGVTWDELKKARTLQK